MNATTRSASPALQPALACEPFAIGAHLVTPRRGYSHHGIYVGGHRVVHYAGWSRAALTCRPVEEVSLEQFADGRAVTVRGDSPQRFASAEVVARARSRLGEDRYRVASNNCEHFCHWCLSGENRSAQVDRLLGWIAASAKALERLAGSFFGADLKPRADAGPC
ncbi:MAG TPA: lecithin retinol acyltransferase family protein [Burkholderiaceae bacterium]|nr:lecithin retinol acyltransferase family protein [Burkholderiaceae bacterium]